MYVGMSDSESRTRPGRPGRKNRPRPLDGNRQPTGHFEFACFYYLGVGLVHALIFFYGLRLRTGLLERKMSEIIILQSPSG